MLATQVSASRGASNGAVAPLGRAAVRRAPHPCASPVEEVAGRQRGRNSEVGRSPIEGVDLEQDQKERARHHQPVACPPVPEADHDQKGRGCRRAEHGQQPGAPQEVSGVRERREGHEEDVEPHHDSPAPWAHSNGSFIGLPFVFQADSNPSADRTAMTAAPGMGALSVGSQTWTTVTDLDRRHTMRSASRVPEPTRPVTKISDRPGRCPALVANHARPDPGSYVSVVARRSRRPAPSRPGRSVLASSPRVVRSETGTPRVTGRHTKRSGYAHRLLEGVSRVSPSVVVQDDGEAGFARHDVVANQEGSCSGGRLPMHETKIVSGLVLPEAVKRNSAAGRSVKGRPIYGA